MYKIRNQADSVLSSMITPVESKKNYAREHCSRVNSSPYVWFWGGLMYEASVGGQKFNYEAY